MTSLPSPSETLAVDDADAPNDEAEKYAQAQKEQARKLANWDPSYTSERVDWYKEYTQRHAAIKESWFQRADDGAGDEKETREATGVGVLYRDSAVADKLIAPMDDGSVCLWDLAPEDPNNISGAKGRLHHRSPMGLLTGRGPDFDKDRRITDSKAMMTETGAVECVSIDSSQQKGYFAVQNFLNEVDLHTFQVVSRQQFPFPITALSEAQCSVPMTVGTHMTLHLHDPRRPLNYAAEEPSFRCELIGGTPPNSIPTFGDLASNHATLSQPGPLSILHLPPGREWDMAGDIWVAGRFTSMLGYDRRFFPKIAGTIHSGARISCLTSLPFPFIPRRLGLLSAEERNLQDANALRGIPGTTIIAAGEYKGKGSLEFYGLSTHSDYTPFSTGQGFYGQRNVFQNRQTASRSKLLSVVVHGTTFAYSDGDGLVKWVERDGFTSVRQWNLNPESEIVSVGERDQPPPAQTVPPADDIVQKMIPVSVTSSNTSSSPDNLLIWTGEGKLGLLSYGKSSGFDADAFEAVLSAEDEQRRRNEREYAGTMRRALEQQADEVRWFGSLRFD